jgi:hypothetical protein
VSRIFPSIPDPQSNVDSLYSTVRALKYTVELLTGQSGAVAAARVFVQAPVPSPLASGDLWIDTSRNNKLLTWDGIDWRVVTV